jgi:hypothetical protein
MASFEIVSRRFSASVVTTTLYWPVVSRSLSRKLGEVALEKSR